MRPSTDAVPPLDIRAMTAAEVALALECMTRMFETARMYTKGTPALVVDNIFGVTSFELG